MTRRRLRLLPCVAALAGMGCAPALRPISPALPGSAPDTVALAAEVHALAREVAHEPVAARRAALVERAVVAGQRCKEGAPQAPPCDYALAIAIGMQVRERPATARDGLARMLALLRRAAASAPGLDHGGPDRVTAILLLRAPGWPLGPGDPDEALAAARRAVALDPAWAPNPLALAEALAATGDAAGSRETARRALELVDAARAAGEPDAPEWQREAQRLAGATPGATDRTSP